MRDYKAVVAKAWLILLCLGAMTALSVAFYVETGLGGALAFWGVIVGFALTVLSLIYLIERD